MRARFSALLMALVAAAAMAEPPKADVRFAIEAQEFVDGLGKARSSVEHALTQMLVEECRAQKTGFPFINWVSNDQTAPNRLVVVLAQRKAGAGTETFIEYRGTTKVGSPPPTIQEVVYRWFDAKNADLPEVLRPALEKRIHNRFKDVQLRKELLEYFVSQVPLAERIDLDNPSHRVIVPVPAVNLLADETQSQLAVSFYGKSDGRPGAMTLSQPQDYPTGGGVLCLINQFNYGGVLDLIANWNDRIPQVYVPAKVRDVRVTMTHYAYKWYPDTNRGSVRND